MIYQLTHDPDVVIRILEDSKIWIPENNIQWLEYQDWLAQGNTPLPPTPLPVNLDWQSCQAYLINFVPDSAYLKLTEWSKTSLAFNDCKGNISKALTDKNEDYLKFALSDLKSALENDPDKNFNSSQLTEIDLALEFLGVDWRWLNL